MNSEVELIMPEMLVVLGDPVVLIDMKVICN